MDIETNLHLPLEPPWKQNQKCPCGGTYTEHLEQKIIFLRKKQNMCPRHQRKFIGEYISDLKILLNNEKKKNEQNKPEKIKVEQKDPQPVQTGPVSNLNEESDGMSGGQDGSSRRVCEGVCGEEEDGDVGEGVGC